LLRRWFVKFSKIQKINYTLALIILRLCRSQKQDRIISRMKELNHQGHNNQSTFDNLNKKYDVQESIVEHNTRNLEKQESTNIII
jgi:hypothetical protein